MPVVAKAISWGNAERLTVSSSVLAALPKRCTQYRNTAKTDKLTRLCPTDEGMENPQVERPRVRNALGWHSVVWRIGNVRLPRPGPFADPRERDGAFPLRHRSNPVLQLRVGTGLRPALSEGIRAVGFAWGMGHPAGFEWGGDRGGRPTSGGGVGAAGFGWGPGWSTGFGWGSAGDPSGSAPSYCRDAGRKKGAGPQAGSNGNGRMASHEKPGSCDPG